MAGTGPAPAEQRRRRNEPARGDWVDLEPLAAPVLPVLPELPARMDGEDWSPMTRMTWEAWRQDPVTAQWSPSDRAYALDTIKLYDGMTASSANEVRIRMDGLGLTPKGKRDLRWRVPAADEQQATSQRQASARRGGSRKARLSVVQ